MMQHINNIHTSINNQDGDRLAGLISLKASLTGRANPALVNAAERVCA